ncbi:DUF4190 domain-containing protein [Agromyces marinus]|uniref:DUF4190 domain-containing protein n=1 Tax=Agromyces marinus TaxID=1389020 RepID=A0ABN6YBC1_9MICO|nr:DUF4190 domain-containing protein [Agromyces marinus]UIP57525.1 hypothetical protein DSM26151_03870 [Agromyces marinus]BDZ54336.1 hypothetical protein GCM10025870_14090 [Agromyces marinus]
MDTPAQPATQAHAQPAMQAQPAQPYAPAQQPGVAPVGYQGAPGWVPTVAPPQNVLAWVSLSVGLGAFLFGPLASIAAIVCGHIARRQIRERGEQGAGAALTGLILGYSLAALMFVGIGLYVLILVAVFSVPVIVDGVPASV